MDAEYDIFEIVAVTRNFWLIDAESYQRRYCTNHGGPLVSGYYVVNWPEHIQARRFNEHAAFHGPFNVRKDAQAALRWMCQEREQFLAMSSGTSPVPAPNSCKMEVKKAAPRRLRLVAGAKAKPMVTRFPSPDYRNAVKVTV